MGPRPRARIKHRLAASSSLPGQFTLNEILSQPVIWEETNRELERQGTLAQVAQEFSPTAPWLFVACGSSYYLSQIVAYFWSRVLQVPCRALPASELLFDSEEILRHTGARQAVLLSRSGETTEVLRAAELLKKPGSILTLAATCNESSSLEKLCTHTLKLTAADEKSLVMTRSFTSYLLAFQRLGALMIRDHASLATLDRLPARVAPWLRQHEKQIRRFGTRQSFTNFVFLGQGAHYWLAQEAALKVTEMSSSFASAYHTLEFRHGPRSMIGRQSLVTFLVSDAAAEEESLLVEEMKELGAATFVVTNSATPGLKRSSDLLVELELDEPGCVRLAAMAIPAHLLGFAVGLRNGLNPDAPKNVTRFVTLNRQKNKSGR